MKQEWIINQNGQEYLVTYMPKKDFGEDKLYVDGMRIEIEKSSYVKFVGFDQEFMIEDKKYHFVVNGHIVDIAVDGKYINSRESYMPLKKLVVFGFFAILILVTAFLTVIVDPPLYMVILLWAVSVGIYIWARKSGLPGYYTKN